MITGFLKLFPPIPVLSLHLTPLSDSHVDASHALPPVTSMGDVCSFVASFVGAAVEVEPTVVSGDAVEVTGVCSVVASFVVSAVEVKTDVVKGKTVVVTAFCKLEA